MLFIVLHLTIFITISKKRKSCIFFYVLRLLILLLFLKFLFLVGTENLCYTFFIKSATRRDGYHNEKKIFCDIGNNGIAA